MWYLFLESCEAPPAVQFGYDQDQYNDISCRLVKMLSVPAEPARCPSPEKPASTTAKTTVVSEEVEIRHKRCQEKNPGPGTRCGAERILGGNLNA